MKIRYYHCSPYRLKIGTILQTGVKQANYRTSQPGYIYLTTDPVPHYTIIDKANKESWFVYEVEPIGQLEFWGAYEELVVKQAEITRFVGNAKGIIKNYKKHHRKGYGSKVVRRHVSGKAKGTGKYYYTHHEFPCLKSFGDLYLFNRMYKSPVTEKERDNLYKKLGITPKK